jgi:flagellar hook assembly protein FlgD
MGTIIRYELPKASDVEIAVFDAPGRRLAVVDRGRKAAGENACRWDGRDASGRLVQSGVYFLRLRASSGEAVRKMVVVR